MVSHIRKSSTAARELSIPYHRLIGLIRYGLIAPPVKDTSGDYLWSEADLASARLALEGRSTRSYKSKSA
jgi:hypothetical protein